MPLLWDIYMSVVSGFLFSSLKPILENKNNIKLKESFFYFIGLLFNQLIILLISVWCWVEVDPNWLLLYTINPENVGSAVHLIYGLFPFYYTIPYLINLGLRKVNKARFSFLLVQTSWLIFTIIIFPSFITLFGADDTILNTQTRDYPAQFIWSLYDYPNKNALWFLPLDFHLFFLMFFVLVLIIMIIFQILAIQIARTNFFSGKNAYKEKTPKIKSFLTARLLDLTNKQIISTAKRDYRFLTFLNNFNAKIQFTVANSSINRFLVFNGTGSIVYAKGRIQNPDGELIFRSINDAFNFIKNFGDMYEGMVENRFEIRGNLNILLKYQFLTNFFNPKQKKINNLKQKIISKYN